jgi:4-amino-4-deoxy-L-arabinose transferase-like glycosyltransferase
MTQPDTPPAPVPPEPSAITPPARSNRRWLLWGGLLTLACLILRVANLRGLPIFGDESIYLRWAQLIRGEAVSAGNQGLHLWVSLADPKPPLHFWLIALFYHWASDPLVVARLISVLAGVAGIPAMLGIGRELGELLVKREKQISGRALGFIAAILAILCPFIAFYQRLATADALFTAESLFIVWFSLRWARLTLNHAKLGGWLTAFWLGLAIGAGLLTRQGVSYTICAMPVTAWLLTLSRTLDDRARNKTHPPPPVRWLRGIFQLLVSALIAAAIWTPYLTAELYPRAREINRQLAANPNAPVSRDELLSEVKRRIMYQKEFTQAGDTRWAMAKRNAFVTFIPAWNDDANPNSGWLPLYMTPLVLAMCVAGLIYAAVRQRPVFIILLMWALVLLAPVVLLVENIFSRYVLAGVPPLLFAGALLLGDTTAALPRKWGWIIAAGLWAVLLAMPVLEIGRQIFAWQRQTLTWGGRGVPSDRYQYLTGWDAGYGTQGAIAYLREAARTNPERPMVVITTDAWGLPADAVWVYLSREPNVRLFFVDGRKIIRPGGAKGTYMLKDDKWLFPPERAFALPAEARVYFVSNDLVGDLAVPAASIYKGANPNLPAPKVFGGIRTTSDEHSVGAAVFLVPHP